MAKLLYVKSYKMSHLPKCLEAFSRPAKMKPKPKPRSARRLKKLECLRHSESRGRLTYSRLLKLSKLCYSGDVAW
jgi:hypothetical protein